MLVWTVNYTWSWMSATHWRQVARAGSEMWALVTLGTLTRWFTGPLVETWTLWYSKLMLLGEVQVMFYCFYIALGKTTELYIAHKRPHETQKSKSIWYDYRIDRQIINNLFLWDHLVRSSLIMMILSEVTCHNNVLDIKCIVQEHIRSSYCLDLIIL